MQGVRILRSVDVLRHPGNWAEISLEIQRSPIRKINNVADTVVLVVNVRISPGTAGGGVSVSSVAVEGTGPLQRISADSARHDNVVHGSQRVASVRIVRPARGNVSVKNSADAGRVVVALFTTASARSSCKNC